MKLALCIEYDGRRYCGWQRQKKMPSIQMYLEKALSMVANETIVVYCAGRTDAGVHATGQVVHFNTKAKRSNVAWTLGVNSNLPKDIAVRWVTEVADDFHARFSAITRRYRYIIYNNNLRTTIFRYGSMHYNHPLDISSMTSACKYLLGENDFSSFRSIKCQSHSPWRNIKHLYITEEGQYIIIDIKANSFVYHMVRNIVGSLLEVGSGKKSESWIGELLASRNRTNAGATAKAQGLYLVEVNYPLHFSLPKLMPGPLFFK